MEVVRHFGSVSAVVHALVMGAVVMDLDSVVDAPLAECEAVLLRLSRKRWRPVGIRLVSLPVAVKLGAVHVAQECSVNVKNCAVGESVSFFLQFKSDVDVVHV